MSLVFSIQYLESLQYLLISECDHKRTEIEHTNRDTNTNKSTNQSKWLMEGWRRLEQVPRLPRWQLSFCASSPAPTCPTAPLSTLPIHSMPCSTIWALLPHQDHLARRAFGAVGRHITTHRLAAHLPTTGTPPAHIAVHQWPKTATFVEQLRCKIAFLAVSSIVQLKPHQSLWQNYNQVIITQLWSKNESTQR